MNSPSEPVVPPPPTVRQRFRRLVLAGLVTLIPVVLTVFLVVQVFRVMDGIFAPLIDRVLGIYLPGASIPGLGAMLTVLTVLLLGWLSTIVAGRRLIEGVERLISRIPLAKSVYSATKGVVEALSFDQSAAFKRVVLVEYPKSGLFAMAFVTRSGRWPKVHPKTADFAAVFVPTTPNPTSGMMLIVPRDEIIELPISVEAGIRMVISGGLLMPDLGLGGDEPPSSNPRPSAAAPEGGTIPATSQD